MKIYLDLEFLEDFLLANDDSDRYSRLKRLLCSTESPAEIFVNFDFEEAYKDPEKRVLFRQIANKLPLSDSEIIEKANNSAFHECATPHLFFMNSDKLSVDVFGCFSLKSQELEKADLLVYPEKYRVDGSRKNWSFISSCKLPCNSLILTDNYLFSNDETYENIFSILVALMPQKLSIDFDLTLIGFDAKKSFKSIKEQSDKILSQLKTHFSYNINLTIVREDHHGRYINTNYTRFQSEKGFGLFKNSKIKPSDETTIEYSSVTEFGRQTSVYEIRKKELEKCKSICRTERTSDKVIGTRKNRLLQ
ncbi:MAG: hypothetical protein MUF45_17650 [Spirosomaceae bacterium]|jgi:hypothetical protein|nr:hypothetical protein [Spirosomataceae bacterium]